MYEEQKQPAEGNFEDYDDEDEEGSFVTGSVDGS
jgi:hypothetical protein